MEVLVQSQVLVSRSPSDRAKSRRWNAARIRAMAFLLGDLVSFGFASSFAFLALGYADRPLGNRVETLLDKGIDWHGWGTLLVLGLLLVRFGERGNYTRRLPLWMELDEVLRAILLALLCDFFITTALYQTPYSLEAILRWVLFVPVLMGMRQLVRLSLDAAGLWSLRTLLVAGGETAVDTVTTLKAEPSLGYDVVGVMSLAEVAAHGSASPWLELLQARKIDFVVLAVDGTETASERSLIAGLGHMDMPFALMPNVSGLPTLGFTPQYFFSHDIMLLVERNNLARPITRVTKRGFDIFCALFLVFLLLPLFLVIGWMVRGDGGPIFFRHQRIGERGRRFFCLKFRSMAPDAADRLQSLLASDPDAAAEWAAAQKLRNDPRVTPIGRFLRQTSLDELPQLLNVLKGEMSLVGPRPIVEDEIVRYGDEIQLYYQTRPGITGLWQVSGRNDTSYRRRVYLDSWYAKNRTLWHDVAILMKTIPAVLLKKGAT
jgi:Undecaprenyl-phosphate galactose phosphotransferase WbaP